MAKITRYYNKICDYCCGEGFVQSKRIPQSTQSTSLTDLCPVCKGQQTIPVTEVIECPDLTINGNSLTPIKIINE